MPQFSYLAELVDPRPHDGGRRSHQGMPLLPVSYECDWMTSNEALLCAVITEMSSLCEHEGLQEAPETASSCVGSGCETYVTLPESYSCPFCSATSTHPLDIQEGYCPACKRYAVEASERDMAANMEALADKSEEMAHWKPYNAVFLKLSVVQRKFAQAERERAKGREKS